MTLLGWNSKPSVQSGQLAAVSNRALQTISFYSGKMKAFSSLGTFADVHHINPKSANASWAQRFTSII